MFFFEDIAEDATTVDDNIINDKIYRALMAKKVSELRFNSEATERTSEISNQWVLGRNVTSSNGSLSFYFFGSRR